MKRRTTWAIFIAAVVACSIVGPALILIYVNLEYLGTNYAPLLIRHDAIIVVCPAWMLGVAEYNSGQTIAFIAIFAGNFIINLIVSTVLLAPAKLPLGLVAALICAVAIVVAREIFVMKAGPLDGDWPAILIAAALYWAPVAVKMRRDARRVLAN